MDQKIDAEVVDQEVEIAPDSTGLVAAVPSATIEDQLELAENIDRLIAAQNKVRSAVLGLAQPGDWVLFKSQDISKAELGFAGAMRIGATLGVSYVDFSAAKESGTDEQGPWYRWEVECTAVFRGRQVRVWGRAGSRDKFFGRVRGELRPIKDIDEGNIKIAARRGAMKEGLKVLFGLHHMDPEWLTKNGIVLANAGGYEFKPSAGAPEVKGGAAVEVEIEVKGVVMRTGGSKDKPWELYTITDEKGAKYTTFSKTMAQVAKDCQSFNTKAKVSGVLDKYGAYSISAITPTEKATA